MIRTAVNINQPLPLFTAVILGGVSVIIFNALPVILGVASDDLGLTAEQLGLMASFELGGIGLASVSGLLWVRRVPWRPTVLVATLALVTGDLLSAFAGNATELIGLRFLTGLLGEGVVLTVAFAAVSDARQSDRAFAYFLVGQVGVGMLALFGFPYVATSLGFAGLMVAMAILSLLCLALLPWLPRGGERDESVDDAAQTKATKGSITTPAIGLAGLTCWFVGLSGVWAFIERIGMEIPIAQTTIGTLLSLGLGLGAVASLLVALFGHRITRFWPPLTTMAVHVLMCFLLAGKLGVIGYGAIVLSLTFVWNIGLPYLLGLISDSDHSGRLVVLLVSGQAFGNTLGPMLAGQVIEYAGLSRVGISSAVICLLAVLIVAVFVVRARATVPLREVRN